ncbi:MAG: transposase domain-containing protein [Phycisphaerae bacterium]
MSSIYAWLRKFRAGGMDALGIDGRGRPPGGHEVSDEAIARYRELRHSAHRLSISLCFRMVASEAAERGWRWFASDSACRAWDKRNIDPRGLVLTQGGELAFAAKAGPYLEPGPESFGPGEHWESDHTTLNCWAITKGGQIVRPVMTAWLDWRSRAIVGHTLCSTGNSDTILVALSAAAKQFGLPESCQLDNGKDFHAEVWTGGRAVRRTQRSKTDLKTRAEGIFAILGITPRWAMPYSPNSKGRIERFFGTLDAQFTKLLASYCGGRSDLRPEDHRDLVAEAVAWDELAAKLREWIEVYNNSPHSGEGMAGRAPLQVMATAQKSRPLTDEQATFLLAAWPRPVKIGRHGVAITIGGATLRFGAFDAAIMSLPIGTPVRLSYDPADLSFVNVWAADGRFLTRAAENHRFDRSVSSEELRAAMRKKRAAMRKLAAARKSGLAAAEPAEREPVAAAG